MNFTLQEKEINLHIYYEAGSAAMRPSGISCQSGYVLAPNDANINDCDDGNNAVC